MFVATNNLKKKKKFATKVCLPRQNIFVATNTCLSRQKFCRDENAFVATKGMFCRNKHVFVATKVSLSRQNVFVRRNICLDKGFVATNTCLSQHKSCRDKNDTCGSSLQGKGLGFPSVSTGIERTVQCHYVLHKRHFGEDLSCRLSDAGRKSINKL